MKKILMLSSLLFSMTFYADARLAGRACRSIHLGYQAAPAEKVEIEVVPEEAYDGTYFCALGFNMGYFGIQQQWGGKKVVIFSVWDPGSQNNPHIVPEDKQVKIVYHDKNVRTGRFGNEGTGAQSFYNYDWKIGQKCHFRIESEVKGKHTTFTAFFYLPETKKWLKLASFRTDTGGKKLTGLYSFVEDFKRNRLSLKERRAAKFGKLRVNSNGKWQDVRKARFTADSNPATNINAGKKDDYFFLATGGNTVNKDSKLWQIIDLDAKEENKKK